MRGFRAPGVSPRHFFLEGALMVRELSLFCDESGSEAEGPRYYILTLVLHDQGDDIAGPLSLYAQALKDKGLPAIPLHASPLINGNGAYAGLEMRQRKSLLMSFLTMYRHLPIQYKVFVYETGTFQDRDQLSACLRRDLVNFLFDNLAYFQGYDTVKLYYDDGQAAVTRSLHSALEYALARHAVCYKAASPAQYCLAQVADLICTVELTALKYRDGTSTKTDGKVFGSWRAFRENFYKVIVRKKFK
jgi:hypothetical protein